MPHGWEIQLFRLMQLLYFHLAPTFFLTGVLKNLERKLRSAAANSKSSNDSDASSSNRGEFNFTDLFQLFHFKSLSMGNLCVALKVSFILISNNLS